MGRWSTLRVLSSGLLCTLFVSACGTQQLADPTPQGLGNLSTSETAARLQLLQDELARQLSDTASIPLHVPDSLGTSVGLEYSLSEDAPHNITLTWSEALPGDLDLNGEVNAADLMPLARYFGLDAAGYAAAVAPVSGWFWRLDGDGNGELGLGDIVPIAKHYRERIDGYRVYRRLLGSADWTLLPNQQQPDSAMSITHAQAAAETWPSGTATRIVSYSFTDPQTPQAAVEYKVIPYYFAEGRSSVPLALVPADAKSAEGIYTYLTMPLSSLSTQALQVRVRVGYHGIAHYPVMLHFDQDADGSYELTVPYVDEYEVIELPKRPAGEYLLRVRVVDDAGSVAFDTERYRVRDENRAPAVSGKLLLGDLIAPCVIDASYSVVEPEQDAYSVKVEIMRPNGSGRFEANLPRKLFSGGDYVLLVTATDSFGMSGEWRGEFSLSPSGSISTSWKSLPGSFSYLEMDSARLGIVGDRLAVLYEADDSWFYWQQSADNGYWKHDARRELPFNALGSLGANVTFEARLIDVNGRPGIHLLQGSQLSVTNSFTLALNDEATAWSDNYVFSGGTGSQFAGHGEILMLGSQPAMAFGGRLSSAYFTKASDAQAGSWQEPAYKLPDSDFRCMVAQQTLVGGMPCVLTASPDGFSMWRSQDASGSAFGAEEQITAKLKIGGVLDFLITGNSRPALLGNIVETASPTGSRRGIQRALTPDLSQWSDPAPLPEAVKDWSCSLALIGGRPALSWYDQNGMQLFYQRAADDTASEWEAPQLVSNREDVGKDSQLLEYAGKPLILARSERGHNGEAVPAFTCYEVFVPRN